MKGKTILITGSSSGIGLATATELARKGGNIILVARSEDKLKEAIRHIQAETGNAALSYYLCDFSSQKAIRALSEKLHKGVDKIDVLINNAGGVYNDFTLSEDGLEMTIATNHFAYFLLTRLLLDLIQKSDYARIVNVASRSHYSGKIDFDSFTTDKGYFILKAYGQSKLANVLFTQELAEQLKDTQVTVNSLHPGLVSTQIGTKGMSKYTRWIWDTYSKLMGLSPEDGAKTSIYLASSPEVKGITGKYFDLCKQKEPSKLAKDKALQKKLWQVSEAYCKP